MVSELEELGYDQSKLNRLKLVLEELECGCGWMQSDIMHIRTLDDLSPRTGRK